MGRLAFEGVLEPGRGGGALIALPADVVADLGGTRARVRGTFAGVAFASSTMPTGGGAACLGVHRATREAAGVAFGERVAIEIERDQAPREVAIPPELRRALGEDAEAGERFDALSLTHRREYAQWVAEAKRPETKVKRIEQTLERLRGGH